MSERINGYDFKYVEESTEANMAAVIAAVGAEAANEVEHGGVSCKINPHLLEVRNSASEEPTDIIDIGAGVEIKAFLTSGSLAQLKLLLNDEAAVADAIVESTRCFTLLKYHVQFKVRNAGGTVETWTASWLFMQGSIDAAFEGGKIWYLPVTVRSSADSQLQITSA